ncbi:uncharacterized protein [Ambystoma mexicanum]|uniref:uncharacterized protein n=1 Tax=Ambystoma mexicanum TaxID=8296 RepID=UPI0037E82792
MNQAGDLSQAQDPVQQLKAELKTLQQESADRETQFFSLSSSHKQCIENLSALQHKLKDQSASDRVFLEDIITFQSEIKQLKTGNSQLIIKGVDSQNYFDEIHQQVRTLKQERMQWAQDKYLLNQDNSFLLQRINQLEMEVENKQSDSQELTRIREERNELVQRVKQI